jgi:hypothetical protein
LFERRENVADRIAGGAPVGEEKEEGGFAAQLGKLEGATAKGWRMPVRSSRDRQWAAQSAGAGKR